MTQEFADTPDLEEQIDRCRRLAGAMTDEVMRSALEELADEYQRELRLRGHSRRRAASDESDRNECGQGFMLQGGKGRRGA